MLLMFDTVDLKLGATERGAHAKHPNSWHPLLCASLALR